MIKFAGLEFSLLSREQLFTEREEPLFVVTANAEIIVKANEEKEYGKIINNADCTLDGQIPFVLARIRSGNKNIEKISGSDLIYDVCEQALIKKRKVFLLGGLIESNEVAVNKLKLIYPGLQIAGYSPAFSPYPFKFEITEEITQKMQDFRPDYLFVGFGAGKQEMWISDNFELLRILGVKIVVGSGGTFEFVSGKIKRAPKILQKIGLEGVFRLLVEPKFFRFKRILKSFKIFWYAFKN